MIEGFAREMPEDVMADAIMTAHGYIREICELQEELARKVGTVKTQYVEPEPDHLLETLQGQYFEDLKQAKRTEGKQARAEACTVVKDQAEAAMIPDPEAEGAIAPERFNSAWHELESRVVRDLILSGMRADGRDNRTLRPISCCVDLLPRVHGSALFQRGETQALVTVDPGHRPRRAACGRPDRRILAEVHAPLLLPAVFGGRVSPDPRSGPARNRPRGPGRAERQAGAARPRRFPLHDSHHLRHPGVQRLQLDGQRLRGDPRPDGRRRADQQSGGRHLRRPGQGRRSLCVLLTDIIGDEDHFGDMDFKIAGTQNGITGIQLDLKIAASARRSSAATLAQSREARIEILRKMLTAISRPREEISL